MASKRLKKKKQAAAVLQKRTEPENGAVKTERPRETREQTPEEETKQVICFQIETDLKKESEEMKTMNFYIQWNGKEFCQADIVEQIQKQWEAMGNTAESLEKLNIYLKPEESRAYYVANESVQGCVEL